MTPAPLAVAVAGASGRMGQMILREIARCPDLRLSGALVSARSQQLGVVAAPGVAFSALEGWRGSGTQVLIDFSLPGATADLMAAAAALGAAVVLGTTGLSAHAEAQVQAAAQRVAVVRSANMSLGVNLLLGLIRQASRALADFDVEIIETHHRHKRDAPSGTALLMAQAAAAARGVTLTEALRSTRSGDVGPRTAGEIGVCAVRGGDVVGEHTVLLLGEGERVELSHRATSREVFARGAVRAARWAALRPAGFYTMQDVLGLGGL